MSAIGIRLLFVADGSGIRFWPKPPETQKGRLG
jgi:hypothetical protein